MPSAGSTVKSDQRRQAVVTAAVRRFAVKGFFGTTTAEVAAEAGISQPYIYRLFPNKQALFVAAVRHASDRLVQAQLAHLEGLPPAEQVDPDAVLAALRRGYTDLVVRDRELLMFLMQANCAAGDPEVADALRDCFAAQIDFIRTRAQASDEQVRQLMGAELLANVVLALDLRDLDAPWARVLAG